MFEKLLSLLPYNPGLVHQMSFYSRRMREEASIRRVGMVFIVLTFLVQFFAVLSPPQQTSAAENHNDMVDGGISSAADAARHCRDNDLHYGSVLKHYGISCDDVASAQTVTLNSRDEDGHLYSMGRHAYGLKGETEVVIHPDIKRYWRFLWAWDTHGSSSYQALKFHRASDNKTFWILYSCGNLVTIGIPQEAILVGGHGNVPAPTQPTQPQQPEQPQQPSQPLPPTQVTRPAPTCALDSSLAVDSPDCTPCPYNPSIIESNPQCTTPCEFNDAIAADDSACKPCDQSTDQTDALACVDVHKTASNVTTGATDANGTTANPGDVITYTLFAENKGKATISGFTFQEDLSDVLVYADATDLHGGTMDSDQIVSWDPVDIAPGETANVQLTVKVKNPIPATPASVADPGQFDLTMTNVYGNTINIKVPGPPVKTVEVAAAKLPNTGPGSGLAVAAVVMIIGGYFYSRARLLSQESRLAVKEVSA